MRAAKHAYFVAKEVNTIKELKADDAEDRILQFESLLEHINQRFNQGELIGNSLFDQSRIIGQRVDDLLSNQEPASTIIPVPNTSK